MDNPMTKLNHRELFDMIQPYQKYVGRRMRHIKSDSVYIIVSINLRESDLAVEFSYFRAGMLPIVTFSRPIGELLDGRWVFE